MNKKILQRLIPSQIPDRFMTSENLDHTNHNYYNLCVVSLTHPFVFS